VDYAPTLVEVGADIVEARKRTAEGLLKERFLGRIGWTAFGSRIRVSGGDYVSLSPGEELWGLTYRSRNGYGGESVEEQIFIFGLAGVRALKGRRRWHSTAEHPVFAETSHKPGY
jgi:hypothetical protein